MSFGFSRPSRKPISCRMSQFTRGNAMSYSEARNHFDKARNTAADEAIIDIADGLKHLSHAIEEDIIRLEQVIRDIQHKRN
jgi:hypothetical protein